MCVLHAKSLSHVQLFVTPWTIAHQAPLSMGFSRQDYWSWLPCPPPRDLPNPGIEPSFLKSPTLAGGFFTTSATWEAPSCMYTPFKKKNLSKLKNQRTTKNKTWTCGETCMLNYSSLLKPPRWCNRDLKFHLCFVSFAILWCVKKREE